VSARRSQQNTQCPDRGHCSWERPRAERLPYWAVGSTKGCVGVQPQRKERLKDLETEDRDNPTSDRESLETTIRPRFKKLNAASAIGVWKQQVHLAEAYFAFALRSTGASSLFTHAPKLLALLEL
jgi:hypothetical protein